MVVEELIIKKGDKEIYGNIYYPNKEGKFPAVILSHGFNGSYSDFVTECEYYASHGFIAYSFDFCGGSVTSKSSGKTTDMTIFSEKQDLLIVLEHISNLENVEEKRIYLFGGSHGGLVTALVAAEKEEQVRAIAMYYPALCVADNWNKAYPFIEDIPETTLLWDMALGKQYFMAIRDFKVYEHICSFEEPVLVIHGDEDEIVPLEYSKQVVDKYKNAKLVVLSGEGHGYTKEGGTVAMEKVLKFFSQH